VERWCRRDSSVRVATPTDTVKQSEEGGHVRDKRAKRRKHGTSDRKEEVVCAAGEAITRSPSKSARR
jgi:hypothetical protein